MIFKGGIMQTILKDDTIYFVDKCEKIKASSFYNKEFDEGYHILMEYSGKDEPIRLTQEGLSKENASALMRLINHLLSTDKSIVFSDHRMKFGKDAIIIMPIVKDAEERFSEHIDSFIKELL